MWNEEGKWRFSFERFSYYSLHFFRLIFHVCVFFDNNFNLDFSIFFPWNFIVYEIIVSSNINAFYMAFQRFCIQIILWRFSYNRLFFLFSFIVEFLLEVEFYVKLLPLTFDSLINDNDKLWTLSIIIIHHQLRKIRYLILHLAFFQCKKRHTVEYFT